MIIAIKRNATAREIRAALAALDWRTLERRGITITDHDGQPLAHYVPRYGWRFAAHRRAQTVAIAMGWETT